MSKVEESWKNIDIYNAAQTIKNFSTGVFPSHWLEMVKSRLYDGDEVASWTLHRIVRDILTSLSPICPFFTHYLSTTLYNQSSVDVRQFPDVMPIVSELLDLTTQTSKARRNRNGFRRPVVETPSADQAGPSTAHGRAGTHRGSFMFIRTLTCLSIY